MKNFISWLKPKNFNKNDDNDNIIKEDKKNKNELLKNLRKLLMNYMINQNSTDEDFNNIIKENNIEGFTVNEALEYAHCNPYYFIYLYKKYCTNYNLFFDKKDGLLILKELKNNNPYNVAYTKPPYLIKNNPYFNEGVSNNKFNEIWKLLKKKYFLLKDSDKELTAMIYSIDELKEEVGFGEDIEKDENDNNLNNISNFNIPKTKGELYNYWNNLIMLHNGNKDSILGNINTSNMNDELSNIKIVFITLKPNIKDLNSRLLFQNDDDIEIYNKYISNIKSDNYICINICNNITNNKDTYINCFSNIFNNIIQILPKSIILIPCNKITADVFGCNDITIPYKYNNKLIINAILNNDINIINNIINDTFKKPRVGRANSFKIENIITNINNINEKIEKFTNNEDIKIENIQLNDLIENDTIVNNNINYSGKKYTFGELENILNDLKEYNIIYCSKKIVKANNKETPDKRGDSYIVIRKNNDKKIFFLDGNITIGYTNNPINMIEEKKENLVLIENVKLSNIKYKAKEILEHNPHATLYNTDFADSTYILSKIRNEFKYKEGSNKPRITILDFETEEDAIKVRPTFNRIDAKCRLFTLLDSFTSTAYCGILYDNDHHDKETIDKLRNIKEHEGYKVDIKIFNDEKDLWNHLINLLIEIDPDIITGWNIESFDMVYAVIRCNTLGIQFKNKYGLFTIVKMNNGNYTVSVDGMVILDYLVLYRVTKTKKQESYKLEYICQSELKKGKRPMIVNDHNQMYYNHLYEYTLYNIEDSARVFELDNKMNFIQFKYELANVCNISWDDIYAQTKLIDGLVYNYSMYNNTLIRSRSYNNYNVNNEEEIETGNIKLDLLNELQSYITNNDIDYIDNGKISLKKYTHDSIIEIIQFLEKNKNNKSKNKGYEGAIVLKPQIGIHNIVADLDASQMYPRLMIRSNIFIDTLCAIIAYDNENMAEKWIYDNENFPDEIPLKLFNSNTNIIIIKKEEFREYLKDKILTPFGTIYWKPSIKRSLVSNILIDLIGNRLKYKDLMKDSTKKYGELKEIKGDDDLEVIEYKKLMERYSNIQNSYKYLINAIYGVMGTVYYRLSNSYSAASITASGRELTRLVAHFASMYMDEMIKENRIDVDFEKIPLTFKTLKGFEDIENRRNTIYGDTDSSMFLIGKVVNALYGTELNEDQIVKYALEIIERVSQFINKYIIKYILIKKNINFDDEDNKFNYEYKKEWVAKKIMLGESKKQYAMHLIYKDGEKLNDIDIKGMSTIKSDNSRFTREFLNDITNYILMEYDPDNIQLSNKKMIEKYKEAVNNAYYLADIGSVNIGRPVSITQNLNDYETIQSSIRGMLLYDIFYDYEFLPESKGYQFDICKINWENTKFSSPEDVKEIFYKKYNNYKWFPKVWLTIDKLLFKSITIPIECEKLDTTIFTIDKPILKESAIKKKIEKIMEIVGIEIFDKDDLEKQNNKKVTNTLGMGTNAYLRFFNMNNDDNDEINSTI